MLKTQAAEIKPLSSCINDVHNYRMKTIKTRPPMGSTGKATSRAACDAEQSVLFDFLARGRRAQEAVDSIIAAEADCFRSSPPKRDE
jgi:hypothetical protein